MSTNAGVRNLDYRGNYMNSDKLLSLLRCPDCQSRFTEQEDALRCPSCSVDYPIEDDIPRLIARSSSLNHGEIAVQDHVSEYYEDVRYAKPWSVKYHERNFADLVRLTQPRGTVLDAGCGTGAFSEFLRQHAPEIEAYVGLDISEGMLTRAGELQRRQPDWSSLLVQADTCKMPFADASFDTVFARGLLHHLPDPASGIAEIRRVLRPGSVAVLLEPNKTVVSTLPRYVARKGSHFDEDHKNFRFSELASIIESGLSIDEVHYFGYAAYPLLGFPDIVSFDKWLPLDRIAPWLMKIDDGISAIPGINRLGWGVIVTARR